MRNFGTSLLVKTLALTFLNSFLSTVTRYSQAVALMYHYRNDDEKERRKKGYRRNHHVEHTAVLKQHAQESAPYLVRPFSYRRVMLLIQIKSHHRRSNYKIGFPPVMPAFY